MPWLPTARVCEKAALFAVLSWEEDAASVSSRNADFSALLLAQSRLTTSCNLEIYSSSQVAACPVKRVDRKSTPSQRQLLFVAIMLTFAFIGHHTCGAQSSIGIQPYGSFTDGFDDINQATLAPHIDIPLYTHTGRGAGMQMGIHLTYDDSFESTNFYPGDLGWRVGPSIGNSGLVSRAPFQTTSCKQPPGILPAYYYNTSYQWTFTDNTGYTHVYPAPSWDKFCPSGTESTTQVNEYPTDGAGYLLIANGTQATVTDPSGRIIPLSYSISVTDANGNSGSVLPFPFNGTSQVMKDNTNNSITVAGGNYVLNGSGVATSRAPFTGQYVDGAGNQRTFTINWKMYSVVRESIWPVLTPRNLALVDNVQLADGSAYSMTYEPSPTVSGAVTGRLSSITLPTGGVITYTYASDPSLDQLQAKLIRSTPDGSTTYSTSITSTYSNNLSKTSVTTISKPDQSSEQVFFVGGSSASFTQYETKHLWLDASGHVVRTSMRCYNGASGDCTSILVTTFPFTQISNTETLENGQSSHTVETYNSAGMPTELDEYDYGSSTPTKRTLTQYAPLGNNIRNAPASVMVYDGATTLWQKTTFSYDQTSLATAGGGSVKVPGLGTVTGSRGNMTKRYDWSDPNTSVSTEYAYDTAGQILTKKDPKLGTTTYVFDQATDSYLTSVTRPATGSTQHVVSYTPDPATGAILSSIDENGVTTKYEYNDPFLRVTAVKRAVGTAVETWKTFSYDSPNRSRVFQDKTTKGDRILVSEIDKDSLGRTSLTIDPSAVSISTAYDVMGRISRKSNAFFSPSDFTFGYTQFAYDAIGRLKTQTNPDSSQTSWSYAGNVTTYTDEASHSWQRTTDALGRLIKVVEPGGAITSYTYNPLGDLLGANQSGVGAEISRSRNFSYDLLSRLVTAQNPETGLICYGQWSGGSVGSGTCQNGYDANGNLAYKTNALGVVMYYSYDPLNRMTQKQTTASVGGWVNDAYAYDGPYGNDIGRLSSMGTAGTGTQFTYDQLGRVTHTQEATKDIPWSVGFNAIYDLADNLTSLT